VTSQGSTLHRRFLALQLKCKVAQVRAQGFQNSEKAGNILSGNISIVISAWNNGILVETLSMNSSEALGI
jgi:hypothetical protein